MFSSFAITLPETAIPDLLGTVSGIFSDLSPLIFLLFGIYIGLTIISFMIRWFWPKTFTTETGEHYKLSRSQAEFYGGDEFDDDDDDDEE